MRIRLKFKKEGRVKYVGHLDSMRLFQRAIKVARIPVAYSKGFSPHSLVYFALPLGVGVSSIGEYMEIITEVDVNPNTLKDSLNEVLVDGISITDAWIVEDKGDSLMSLVTGADYKILLYPEDIRDFKTNYRLKDINNMEEIVVSKKSKKGIKQVDIRPLILDCSAEVYDEFIEVKCKVLAGSSQNLSPDLLVSAMLENEDLNYRLDITREEMYTSEEYIKISEVGRVI